jgi:hypothetical protein
MRYYVYALTLVVGFMTSFFIVVVFPDVFIKRRLVTPGAAIAQTTGQRITIEQPGSSPRQEVRVQSNFNFFIPGPTGESEEAQKLREKARRIVYEMAAHECDLLREVFASDCRLESVNDNINVNPINRQFQQQEGFNVNGSMSFQILLKNLGVVTPNRGRGWSCWWIWVPSADTQDPREEKIQSAREADTVRFGDTDAGTLVGALNRFTGTVEFRLSAGHEPLQHYHGKCGPARPLF